MVRSSLCASYTVAALASSFGHAFLSPIASRRSHRIRRVHHDGWNVEVCAVQRGVVRHRQHDGRMFLMTQSTSRTQEEVQMTTDALEIVKEAIRAVNPSNAVKRHVRVLSDGLLQIGSGTGSGNDQTYNSKDFDSVLILAFGKASSAMATACVQQLRDHDQWRNLPMNGSVIIKDDHATKEESQVLIDCGVHLQEASHPVPDQRSVDGARRIMQLARDDATEKTLVLCCISGGGSSLFCEPLPPLSLQELQLTNSILLASGLSITDMNVIRKRLETGKGGKLAAAVYPATLVTLVLSDILGDPLDLIASGPTVPDSSTPHDAWRLIESNPMLREELPAAVLQLIRNQVDDDDGPLDPSHTVFSKASTILVGNNELAVLAAADEAQRRGYNPVILGTRVEGEARHVAGVLAAMAQRIGGAYSVAPRPAALIAGGETTVTLPPNNSGKGGRNQELALAAALRFHDLALRDVVLASVGTDGTDGPTDAAGAIVDGGTVQRLGVSAEEALQQHNAYPYLKQIEDGDGHCPLIITGPTGTNVADVCVTLIR
ncbi:MOFRL family [Fragilaria crotonensis]|nr:MOFRL family [Fragilaria crotonensis]